MLPISFNINYSDFTNNPYPVFAELRNSAPISFVPELDAILLTKHSDIFICEKNISVFSSVQPDGLMTKLMGQNMMRKDGEDHKAERRTIFPTVSPKTTQKVWKQKFIDHTKSILESLSDQDLIDVVNEFAKPVSAQALKSVTGLTNMTWQEMDRVSQGMIDGCANYIRDSSVEKNCYDCTRSIDNHIQERMEQGLGSDPSLLSVFASVNEKFETISANIKLAISGGQNEPRDAIAGTIATLLKNRQQLKKILDGEFNWLKAFEEYARWMSPIGMSPRRIAKDYSYKDFEFSENDRVFLMFGSANRDEDIFEKPNEFRLDRDVTQSISFGAGPHFCAGAWISKTLIAEVAIPMFFEKFPKIELQSEVEYSGWAFRGPKPFFVKV
jgi:cytochrome P450